MTSSVSSFLNLLDRYKTNVLYSTNTTISMHVYHNFFLNQMKSVRGIAF